VLPIGEDGTVRDRPHSSPLPHPLPESDSPIVADADAETCLLGPVLWVMAIRQKADGATFLTTSCENWTSRLLRNPTGVNQLCAMSFLAFSIYERDQFALISLENPAYSRICFVILPIG